MRFCVPPAPRRTGAAARNRGDWAHHRSWPRRNASPASEFLSLFDPVAALRIDDRDQADDAAVAALPVPGEERKGAASAGDLVDVAADVLDAENAVLEQDAVHRLPIREVVFPVAAAGPLLVFRSKMRMQRPVALWPDGCCQGMVVGLRVV